MLFTKTWNLEQEDCVELWELAPNRINKYTLGAATQGLSNFLKKTYPDEQIKVAIAYDCRNNSHTLAKVVAGCIFC